MAKISFTVTQAPRGKQGILKPDGQGYYEQVIGALGVENESGIHYTSKQAVVDLFNNSSTLRRKMDRGVLRGEVGHPKFHPGMSKADFVNRIFQIYEENTCVHFKEIHLDDSYLKNVGPGVFAIIAKFTPSGAKGDFLDRQIKNGSENVCFSIRSIAEDYTSGGKYMRDLAEVITFDYVNEPGIKYAEKYKSPALESITRGGDILVSQDDFIRAMKEAVVAGIATESGIDMSLDRMFKQFGWTKPTNRPAFFGI